MIKSNFLDKLCINHELFLVTQNKVRVFLDTASPGEMLFIEGPVDVGKKEAINRIAKDIALNILSEDPDNDQIMPVISFFAPALHNNTLYIREILNTWMDQLIPQSAEIELQMALRDREIIDFSQADDRRISRIKTLLRGRNCKIIIIHQAGYLRAFEKSKKHSEQRVFNLIHSIAKETGSVVVFTGPFGTFDTERSIPETTAASQVIDFPAYLFNEEDAISDWLDLVDMIKNELPGAYHSAFRELEGTLMEGSLGCFGLLKKWLQKAVSLKKSNGYESISFSECLLQTRPDANKLQLLLDDLHRDYLEEKSNYKDIRARIGMTKPKKSRNGKRGRIKRSASRDPVASPEDL